MENKLQVTPPPAMPTPQAEPVPVVASEPTKLTDVEIDALDDCYFAAMDAWDTCMPSYLHGFSEWCGRFDAAREAFDAHRATLATPQAEPAVAEQARPSREWYERKIMETEGMENFLPCGALASQSTPPPESAGQGLHYPAETLLSALVMQTAYDKWSDKPTPSDYVRTGWVAAILAANPKAPAPESAGQVLSDEQIRSMWQMIDMGDIEDDIMEFAHAVIAVAAPLASELKPAAAQQARDALIETRRVLEVENNKAGGAICDTIWRSPYETLFDYIDATLAALATQRTPPPESAADPMAFINVLKGAALAGPTFFTQERCRQMFEECVRLESAANPTAQPDGGSKA